MKWTIFLRLSVVGALLMAVSLAPSSSASLSVSETDVCTGQQRHAALAEDQRRVLQQVGSLAMLRDPADVVALAQRGWSVLPHQWVSFRGIGLGIARTDGLGALVPGLPPHSHQVVTAPQAGRPTLLVYVPSPTTADATDPYGPDFPYELVGWAYAAPYDYNRYPTTAGRCYARSDWPVHERGVHDFKTWGFVPVPPSEQFHGQARGNEPFIPVPPGLPHPRLWSLHVWLNRDTGVPSVAILNPHHSIPGIDPQSGVSFFYPDTADNSIDSRGRHADVQRTSHQ